MGKVLKVLGYHFQPSEDDEKRLLHLLSRYVELCDALADIARAHPEYLYAGQLSAADETKELAASFMDIPSRYVNIACSRVLKVIRRNDDDFKFADSSLPIVPLDEKVVSVQITTRRITEEPVLHISIAVDGEGRLIVPCQVEVRDEVPASEAGGARLVYHRHNKTWFVTVTAEVDESSALLKSQHADNGD